MADTHLIYQEKVPGSKAHASPCLICPATPGPWQRHSLKSL